MNKEMLPKLKCSYVRLKPTLRQHGRERRGEGSPDLEFHVEDASKEKLSLRDRDSSILIPMNADHIHAYYTDIDRGDGRRRGILSLNVQLNLDGDRLWVDPLPR